MFNTTPIAQTKKGARVWLQGLVAKGYTGRYTVHFCPDIIVIAFREDGKRKVSPSKGGIVDLESKKVLQWAKGATTATIDYTSNAIYISRA